MKLNTVSILLLFSIALPVLVISLPVTAFGQGANNNDQVYGFDPLLYNGKVYYFYQPGTGGTQYLLDDFDVKGSVTLRGVTYNNLLINYDVYNQELILKYSNNVGSYSLIIFSEAWLDSFVLGGKKFSLISDADTSRRIFQVIGVGSEKVLYYMSKELLLDNFKNGGSHYFSDPKREKYVHRNNKIINYKNNRGFLKAFEKEKQFRIKKYMHEQKVNVKKSDDYTMENLINYCSSLAIP